MQTNMKEKFLPSIVLTAICLVVAALLSVVNMFTAPVILAAQQAAANAALTDVLPGCTDAEDVTENYTNLPASITKVVKASNGYVFQMNVVGYKPGLIVMCGIDLNGKVTGDKYIQSNETLGAEDVVMGNFKGVDRTTINEDLIAGPTARLTTKAYYNAIMDALNAYAIIGGESVDLRSPEQIIDDSCNEAVGTTGLDFVKGFCWSELVGVDEVYTAGEYRVYLVGETYIGANAAGEILTEGITDEERATAESAEAVFSSLTPVDVASVEGVSKRIVKAIYTTASGYYLFSLDAAGYSVNGPSYAHTSGTYIKINLVIDPNGVIESVATVSHDESKGIGDKCATEEYEAEYEGLTNDQITVIGESESGTSTAPGVIAGATYTTQGYQKAIKEAFKAYETLKGGNVNE